jgi:hypothetical protein
MVKPETHRTSPGAAAGAADEAQPRQDLREWFYVLLLLICAGVVISPLLQPGYFWGAHDARHDVYFIFQYNKSVEDGIWFARWGPDWAFGYGYPFWIVYGPLATFVGVLAHQLLGLDYEASVKAVLALSMILSGLAMYGFVRSWLGSRAGLVAAVAYMTIPYHLVDVFVRAAMAESMALAFLPLALWGFRETIVRPRLAAVAAAGMAYALIMWTSNLVALVFTPALAIYVTALLWWRVRDAHQSLRAFAAAKAYLGSFIRHALAPGLALAVGLGLSAAFFVPAVVEQRYINQTQWFGEYYDPAQHFVYPYQLFDPTWGFGISQPGPVEAAQGGMSYQLGAAATLLSLIALALAHRLRPEVRRETWFWAAWALASIFLTLEISLWAWQHVPIVPYAQFPWRYLMLAILPLSILPATLVARRAGGRRAALVSVGLAGLLLISSTPFLKVEIREPTREQGPVSMAALMRFQRTSDEMTGVTAWVDPQQRPMWSDMAELWVQGQEVRTRVDYSQVPQSETLAVNSEEMGSAHEQIYFYAKDPGQTITFNRFWYPGWTAWLLDGKDGKPIRKLELLREDGPLARIVVPAPAGEGYILLRFEDTLLRAFSKWVSLGTLAVLAVLAAMRLFRGRLISKNA